MIRVHAYAKINWALDILSSRKDGYHELDMLMQSIDLHDVISFETADKLTLITNGQPDLYAEQNLVFRAAQLLKKETGYSKGACIRLTKRIPAMAGLGGGSADCAATLRALNYLWGLEISDRRLLELSLSLGADVPFCLTGGLCRVKGIGEMITRLDTPQEAWLLIIMPDGGLSTGAVFNAYDQIKRTDPPADMERAEKALLASDYQALEQYAYNALTLSAVRMSRAVSEAIEELYKTGAIMARMSGSGSAVFGVFSSHAAATRARDRLCERYAFCEQVRTMPTGVEWEAMK